MSYYPTLVVDNALDNVDNIVKFANTLDYFSDPTGSYPGKRSKCISELSPYLFNTIIRTVIGQLYDLEIEDFKIKASSYFQKIDTKFGDGFTHQDESTISCITFLNKDNLKGFGTSLFEFATHEWNSEYLVQRKQYYSGERKIDDNFYHLRKLNNEQFEESVTIENKFNRMIMFDSFIPHKGNGIEGFESSEERLTLVTFIDDLYNRGTPHRRIVKSITP